MPETAALYESLTAREYLEVIAALHHQPKARARARIGELLDRLGLTSARDQRLSEFSNGMKQKVVRAQQSARLFGLIFFSELAASLVSSLLPLVYARPLLAVTFFGLLLGGTVAMEMLLRRRVGTAMAELEFR